MKNKNFNVCKHCSKQFEKLSALKRHEKIHLHQKKKRKCKLCAEEFNNLEEYDLHIIAVHEGQKDHYFMCSKCGKQFKTRSELTLHINSKCGTIKLFKCKVCEKELMSAGSLYNHMLRHNSEPSHMCRFCAKLFLTSGQLKTHERTHTNIKPFVCEVCGKGFSHRQSLITHSTLHTGVKPFICENCGNAFSCIGNLLKHRKTHPECAETPLTSHIMQNPTTKMKVQVNTPATIRLKRAQKEKELNKKLKIYKEQLESEFTPDNFIKQNTPIDTLKHVQICGKNEKENHSSSINKQNGSTSDTSCKTSTIINEECSSLNTTEFHQISVIQDVQTSEIHTFNRTEFNTLSTQIVENQDVEEQTCDKIAITQNHFLSEHKIDGLSQSTFSNIFENKKGSDHSLTENNDGNLGQVSFTNLDAFDDESSQLYNGLNDSDDSASTSNENSKCDEVHDETNVGCNSGKNKTELLAINCVPNKEYSCEHCNRTYSNLRWLQKHIKKHHLQPNKSYKCSCCNMAFEAKNGRWEHQRKEHSDMLSCPGCDKLYSNPSSLKAHQMFIHRGVSKKVYVYICENCGKQFPQKAILMLHKQNNCGDGPKFGCDTCGKKLSTSRALSSHKKTHMEKQLFCKFCGKAFHLAGQLKVHERVHTGEKPFSCLYCPKAFSYRDSLLTHSTMHTGIKPHLCEACGSRFSCVGNLLKHRNTHATTCGVWYNKNKKISS